MKNWNSERYFTLTDEISVYATTLEVNRTLHTLNHMNRPVMFSDILKAFAEIDDEITIECKDRVILPNKQYYLNVIETLSEEEHEWLPVITVKHNSALC